MSAEAKNLEVIARSIKQHDTTCEYPATAVRMNPFEVERLGWDTILGIPVEADSSLGTGTFRIDCDKPLGTPEEVEDEVRNPIRAEPVFA